MKGSTVTKLPKKRGIPVASVTDHALLRWLERVEGIDLAPIHAEMLRRGLYHQYDRIVIQFIEDNSEFDFDAIRRKIMQLVSIPALAGLTAVRYGDVVLRLVEGAVVSITPYHSSLPDTSRRKRAHDLRRPRKVAKKTRWKGDDE